MLSISSIDELRKLLAPIAIPLILCLLIITILIIIFYRQNKKEDNSLEVEYAESLNLAKQDTIDSTPDLSVENTESTFAPQIFTTENNSTANDNNDELKQKIEALETETNQLKDELVRIRATTGDGILYREMKNKWHEKQAQLLQLMSTSPKVDEQTSDLTIHERIPANFNVQEVKEAAYNSEKVDEQTNSLMVPDSVPVNFNDKEIKEAEHSPEIVTPQTNINNEIQTLENKNRLLEADLEALQNEYRLLKEQHSTLLLTQSKIEETGQKNESAVDSTEVINNSSTQPDEKMKHLQEKISALESLPEVLKEKNLLIGFLQNQLEQQVKNGFQTEKEHSELKEQFSQIDGMLKPLMEDLNQMKDTLKKKEQYISYINMQHKKTQVSSDDYKKQFEEKCEELASLQSNLNNVLEQLARNEEKLKINNEVIAEAYKKLHSN
jgi:chromosome segregation ATPase